MGDVVDWYWQYGVQRGADPSDPDRELRKMSVANWLDPVARLMHRQEVISRNLKGKACIALWGPSQTGKSTMLSRYVDGASPDGSDSALTWNVAKPVRFSPTTDWSAICSAYPNTLVFNPYNHGSDASGLASRYVLREDGDPSVNRDYPVEVLLSTDMRVMHSLSVGYQEECQSSAMAEGLLTTFTPDLFGDKLPSGATGQVPDREAYKVLQDLADAMECMRGQERFSRLFIHGGDVWRRTLRPRLMASGFLSDRGAAEHFRSEVLWDGSARLNELFHEVSALGADLRAKWQGFRIVASPEVAAILLDIDSFRVFSEAESGEGLKVKDLVSRLAWTLDPAAREVRLSIGPVGSPEISGRNFGHFQALCSELVVPLRRSALAVPGKEPFLALLEKCDVLDLPGLSNVNRGGTADAENTSRVNLAEASEVDLFKKVFKEGKTQSFVYNYADEFGIDAFLVLVRAERSPSKSSKLTAGIRTWLRSYDPAWQERQPASMPIFLDMTFFATCVNTVAMSGVGTGLAPYATRILDELPFADKATAQWFTTTYPQFPGGGVTNPACKGPVVDQIMADDTFVPRTGLTRERLEAVFEPDGGVAYMLSTIASRLDASCRRARSEQILREDMKELCSFISRHLPTDAAQGAAARQMQLQEIEALVRVELGRIKDRTSTRTYADVAKVLKDLFKVSPEVFDAVPELAYNEDLDAYVRKQKANWYENRMGALTDAGWLDVPHQQTLVGALRDSLSEDLLATFVRTRLGQLEDRRACMAATYSLALAFENIFWYGYYDRKSTTVTVGDGKPAVLGQMLESVAAHSRDWAHSAQYLAVIEPALGCLARLQQVVTCGLRPPQPGDPELMSLFQGLQQAGQN